MANWGGGASGALSGAAAGSAFGPIGAAIGGLGGGLAGLFGGRNRPKKYSTLNKQQQSLMDEYINSVMGQGGQFSDAFSYDPEQLQNLYYQQFAQPAYQQFQEEIIPGITGSFRGNNLQNSSYLGGALGRAGERVQQDLNAKMANMIYNAQQAGIDRRLNSVQNILNTQTFAYSQPQASPFDSLLGGLSQGAGAVLANKFANMGTPKV